MFRRLFRAASPAGPSAAPLYGAIVAQARLPVFYAAMGVPDTVAGRLEMVILHNVLVLRRLRGEGEGGQPLAQALFDLFCLDMDHSMRELGISDLSVPKKMRRVGEAFYGRAAAYDAALDAADSEALAAAILRNILGEQGEAAMATAIAAYAHAASESLAAVPATAIAEGDLTFPDPASYMPVTESR